MSVEASSSSNSKKMKESSEDRISELPDCILNHILSFVPAVDSSRTCILSSRWQHIWTNSTILIFDDDVPPFDCRFYWMTDPIPANVRFAKFVSKALLLHNPQYCLICAATTIFLPNLRTLKLVNVDYEDDEDVSRLMSSCTSLEWLAYYRNSIEIIELNISSCMLKGLEMELPCDTKAGSEVVINAPALEWLVLSISDQVDNRIENIPSLDEADIEVYHSLDVSFDHFLDVLTNIFHALRNVRILIVNQVTPKVTIPKHVFPKFHRLEVLDMNFGCCRWPALQDLIQNSPNLEDLKLTVDAQCDRDSHEICWKNPKNVPDCLLSSLKKVSLHGFKYLKDEISMVKYILKNGRILQKMKIKVSSSLCYKRTKILRKSLSNFHPGSENCEISVN